MQEGYESWAKNEWQFWIQTQLSTENLNVMFYSGIYKWRNTEPGETEFKLRRLQRVTFPLVSRAVRSIQDFIFYRAKIPPAYNNIRRRPIKLESKLRSQNPINQKTKRFPIKKKT